MPEKMPDWITPFELTGKAAIITGGGTGIGAAIAELFAQAGANLLLAGRRLQPLQETANAIQAISGLASRKIVIMTADVRSAAAATALVDKAISALGRLDILVNNAGKATHAPLRKMTAEQWQQDVALNLSAAFYCAQAAYPYLKASSGAIVNISSVAGVHGTMGVGAYSSAKAGLQQLTRVAAAEWGPAIRVNCVAPGMIATKLAQEGWIKSGFDGFGAAKGFPLRRPGRPEEIARTILFLASDAASYITGETLTVGGGPQMKGMIDVEDA